MEDFDYSVEICDRDWQSFFAECEELNLLPPSLAGVDDSGMSDIDDPGCILAKRAQNVNITESFSEAEHTIDGPPDCEGSPVEHYLSKHGIGGMESVLSGSEEDIHLQSVNIFFERLKGVTEAERLTEPSQERAGKNREGIQEEERCSDGQQASSTTLPKNIPKLNSLPARGETAVGKETMESVDTISNIMKTIKKDEPGSNIFPEPTASNSVLKINKSAHPETKLFITEEASTETRVNETTQQSQSLDSPDEVIKVKICTPLGDVEQEGSVKSSQLTPGKECSTDSWTNLEMFTNVKWKEDQNFSQSDTASTNKTMSQELSPSSSVKRKRRKKRRLSFEPAESVDDSEEDQCAWRAGSEDTNLFNLNEPRQNVMSSLTAFSANNSFPVKLPANEIKVNDSSHCSRPFVNQYLYLPESAVRHRKCEGSAENNAPNNSSVSPLSHTDDSVMPASVNNGNVATHVQPFSKLEVEEPTGLNKHPGLPVSVTVIANGKSDQDIETANSGRQDARAGSLCQSDKMNHSIICCDSKQSCTAGVKSLSHCILSSTESSDHAVEVGQSAILSASMSGLAEEVGNSGRENHTLCQRDCEPQQQLEGDCHYKDRYSFILDKTHFLLSPDHMNSCDTHNTKAKQLETRACPFLDISTQVDCDKSAMDTSNPLPDKNFLSKSQPSPDRNITLDQADHPQVCHTLSKVNVPLQLMATQSDEMNQTSQSDKETKSSMSDYLLTTPSDITPVSSVCTLDTQSLTSLSNENITDMSGGSCLSVSQNDSVQGGKTSPLVGNSDEGNDTSGPKSQSSKDAADSQCQLLLKTEDAITASKAGPEKALDSKHSVFAMSSFWSEMEKLTINDILGLRMISEAPRPTSLPTLQEIEEADVFAMTDSGFLDESKPEQTSENTSSDLNCVESSSGSVSSIGVMWESEPVPMSLTADIYTENMLTSVSNISQPDLPGGAQSCLRKIYKNVSVHNLQALETFSYTRKGQTVQPFHEGEFEKAEYFSDRQLPGQDNNVDCSAPSASDSYRISLTDIFSYVFGRNKSNPSESATDNITAHYTEGNSVPETYDHFFSEFDTESFFYPLITTDQTKDELVPVFSYSRSASRNLQFPEAYDYFFASSSSDDSSVESDEEDNCSPVRVVSRLSRKPSSSKISTDIYDNFFVDSDLRHNFFWRNAFSFRNVSFTGSTVQKQTLSNSRGPMRQSSRSLRMTVHPVNALGNPDVMFPDPLLYHLEDRISRQLAQQPFRYEDLQMSVANPGLDAPLLPLRQSDMCLVCIAFASWVLKTANPQVGDAWKAVLLANLSALSAIRYLRRYVKMEAAASERKLHLPALSDS